MKKKKVNRRSKTKYPSLTPQYNLKIRQDLFDQDYVHKLNDKEKAFLDQFNSEFNNASFKKEDKKRKGKRRTFKNLHKTDELRKSCYDANNARNRDIMSKAKATNTLYNIDDVFKSEEDLDKHLKDVLNFSDESSDSGDERT